MPLCNRMFCCIFGWYFYIEIRLKHEKIILLSSSRAFSLSTPTFSWTTVRLIESKLFSMVRLHGKATKCNYCDATDYLGVYLRKGNFEPNKNDHNQQDWQNERFQVERKSPLVFDPWQILVFLESSAFCFTLPIFWQQHRRILINFRRQTEQSLKSRRYKVKPRQFSEKNSCEFSKSQRATDFIFLHSV